MNETKPIRRGEELNETALREFLHSNLPEAKGEISITQFLGGSSNLTYLIKIGANEYILRRPPFGNQVKSAHDMNREFAVLSKLSKIYKPAPQPLIFCADKTVIGSEFYLMQRREGLIIRGKAPADLENSKEMQRRVCNEFIANLTRLHAIDYEKIGLGNFGKPAGYVKRQVEGWTKRYFKARTRANVELEKSIAWLNSEIPRSRGSSLLHNDYKFDNIMLNPENLTEIVAVLDWEMSTVGDPLMDLGTTLAYWMSEDAGEQMLSMPFNPKVLMQNISRKELAEIYAEKSGRDLSNILFYYVFGTFKVAVIAQQIYFRFVKGFTKDERFSRFNIFVDALGKIALQAIEKGKI